jgi:hypothetical protein
MEWLNEFWADCMEISSPPCVQTSSGGFALGESELRVSGMRSGSAADPWKLASIPKPCSPAICTSMRIYKSLIPLYSRSAGVSARRHPVEIGVRISHLRHLPLPGKNFRGVVCSDPSSHPSFGLVCSGTVWRARVLMRRTHASRAVANTRPMPSTGQKATQGRGQFMGTAAVQSTQSSSR